MLAFLPDLRLAYRDEGPRDGPALLLCHALGTHAGVFDAAAPLLPPAFRVIRYDARGHGGSDVPPAPYAMGALVRDAERLLDHLAVKGAVVAGVSMGGLVAQGLAVKRPDLVRALILSNTAHRIATPAIWADRVAAVRAGGMAAVSGPTMERWFARGFRETPEALRWRDVMEATDPEGWCGCAAAIGGADFFETTSRLRLPALAIAGSHDGSTPPDLMRDTAALIPGCRFQLLRRSGHLPPVDAPQDWAAAVSGFLSELGRP